MARPFVVLRPRSAKSACARKTARKRSRCRHSARVFRRNDRLFHERADTLQPRRYRGRDDILYADGNRRLHGAKLYCRAGRSSKYLNKNMKQIRFKFFVSAAVVLSFVAGIVPAPAFAHTAQPQTDLAKRLAAIEQKVDARRKELGIPGIGVAIVKD